MADGNRKATGFFFTQPRVMLHTTLLKAPFHKSHMHLAEGGGGAEECGNEETRNADT